MSKNRLLLLMIAFFIIIMAFFVAFIFMNKLSGSALWLGVIVVILAVVEVFRAVYNYQRNTKRLE